jgi:hypothetical protein
MSGGGGKPEIDSGTGRLTVATARHLERLVGGEPLVEDLVVRYILARWEAKNLLYLPLNVAAAILTRPADFIRAAKQFCPEVPV